MIVTVQFIRILLGEFALRTILFKVILRMCRFCGRKFDCKLGVRTNHESCLQQLEFYLFWQKFRGGDFDRNSKISLFQGGPLVVNFHVTGGGEVC